MASREQRRYMKKQKGPEDQKTSVDRQRKHNPVLYTFAVIIVVLICITFIGTGMIGSNRSSYVRRIFGEYNDMVIEHVEGSPFYEYQKSFGRYYEDLYRRFQSDIDSSVLMRQAVQAGFNETVKLYATVDRAEKSGYRVSTDAVSRDVVRSPYFVNSKTGRFDETQFMNTQTLVKDNLRETMRLQLISRFYTSDLLDIPFLSDGEIEFYKSLFGTERSVKLVSFSYEEYPVERVKAYGTEKAKLFRSANLSRITLANSTREEAAEIAELYRNGQRTFEDMAMERSTDSFSASGGSMGKQFFYAVKNIFGDDEEAELLAEQIFSSTLNDVTAPIALGDSWVLFLRTSEMEEADMNNEEALSAVKEYIRSYDNNVISEYISSQAESFQNLAAAEGLEAAAEKEGKAVAATNYFPLNYLNVLDEKSVQVEGDSTLSLTSASNNADFYKVVFSLKEGEVSAPVFLDELILVMELAGEKEVTAKEWAEYNTKSAGSIPSDMKARADEMDHPYFVYSLVLNTFSADFNRDIVDPAIKAKLDANFEANFNRYFVGSK